MDAVGGRASVGVLVEAGGRQLAQPRRQAVEVGGAPHDAFADARGVVVAERAAPGRRVHQDAAEREHVGRGPGDAAVQLFGGAERRCRQHRSDDEPGLGDGGPVGGAGDAEVDHARSVGRQRDLVRGEASVGEPDGVHGVERVGQSRGQDLDGLRRERTVRLDGLAQRGARHVRGGDPRHRTVGVGVDDGDGVWAGQLARRGDLLREARAEVRVGGGQRPHGLEYDRPAGGRRTEEDLADRALAEHRDEAVAADLAWIVLVQGPHRTPSFGPDRADGRRGHRRAGPAIEATSWVRAPRVRATHRPSGDCPTGRGRSLPEVKTGLCAIVGHRQFIAC
ncbi:hypothetical protein QI554_07165 [Yinghuangia seranimata]|nr:hypothetical protein [Yinghuangia seranimata]MDI2125923.1 hypothetical protein [Yinghuangia seranimata]